VVRQNPPVIFGRFVSFDEKAALITADFVTDRPSGSEVYQAVFAHLTRIQEVEQDANHEIWLSRAPLLVGWILKHAFEIVQYVGMTVAATFFRDRRVHARHAAALARPSLNVATGVIARKFGGVDVLQIYADGDKKDASGDTEPVRRTEELERFMAANTPLGAAASVVPFLKAYWGQNHVDIPDDSGSVRAALFQLRQSGAPGFLLLQISTATMLSLAWMAIRNVGLNINTLPVQSVGVGIGVDYAIYIVDRIRQECADTGDLDEAVRRAVLGYSVFRPKVATALLTEEQKAALALQKEIERRKGLRDD
jgi:predicted RND superfamily exporter protein